MSRLINYWRNKSLASRSAAAVGVILISFSLLPGMFEAFNMRPADYSLSPAARKLIGEPVDIFTQKLQYDGPSQSYQYNKDYVPSAGAAAKGQIAGPRFSANFSTDPRKGMDIIDSVNQVSVGFIPDFGLAAPQQDANRLVYPLRGLDARKVISMKASSIKEDIILESFQGNEIELRYKLKLSEGTEARMEQDGSLGIYGADPALLGEVATGNDNDQRLLSKARQKAEKSQLLFTVPAPFIVQASKKPTQAKAYFSLQGDTLKIKATNLKSASYPLSIDPSVYIETAAKLMRGNNESNIDFDVTNELIQKGKTTGGRFDSWTSTMALPSARWNHATAVAGGYIYTVGGNSGSAQVSTVYWAKFNPTTGVIEATNPGNGACANWCTSSSYDLPAARDAASLVAYNGYLYLFGGRDGSGNRTSTVYIAKIGANGEPSLWHPTDTNKNNWVYWYSDAALSSERSFTAAAAYNNRMYLLGGQTNASAGGVTTVEYAEITPLGTLGTWTSTGMVELPSVRHNQTVQIYNDRVYLVGGNSSGTLQSSVHYIKLASDGTMQGSWTATTSFTTARMAWGGSFSVIWGGYLYISAGCSAVNASGYCTTIAGDTQLASINADGTLTDWQSITATSSRIGYGMVVWRNVIYGIGGCTAQNTTNGNCTTTATTTQYAPILQDGEASDVRSSVASGTSPCVSATWYNCNMPPIGNGAGEGGQMSGGAVVNNGFIYYIGGCYSVGSGNVCHTGNSGRTADTISWSAISSDGNLVRGSSCGGTYYGSWCVDNTNTINGTAGLAAFGYAVFNNVIYVVGGTDGTDWQSTVWRNPLNADGSLGTWSTQTFANLDLGAFRGYSYVFARANPGSAGTFPGNLYVIGGCGGATTSNNGLDCSGTQHTEVYKCNITTTGALEEGDSNDCTTSGQVQIDSEPGTSGNQGLGVMAGAVYANYVYLVGGQSPNEAERGQVMYARIDNNNNIVDVDGETTTDNIWETATNSISPVRRRSAAFGYNGYLYAMAGYNVNQGGSLNDLVIAKIDVSNGSIGAFYTSTVTISQRWDLRTIVNNGYAYTFGGCSSGAPPASCTAMTATIQTFQLYNNYSGSPAAYSAGANLFTTDRIGASAAVHNGYIYLAGGCISATDCTDATSSVQYASLSSTGAIGTWSATSANLPADRAWGQLETAGGYLYYLGGQDDTEANEQSTVYYGQPSSGNVSSWSTASGGIGDTSSQAAQARTKFGAAVWNNRIYIVGGLDGSAASTNTVYISPQLNSGGDIAADSWTADSDTLNVARSGNIVVAYANNLYSFAGYDGTNYLNDSQLTQINSDGTIDSWSYTTSLPTRIRQGDGFAANGFMYIFGGRSADTTCDSNTIVAPVSANTTIATGNNPTGLGDWFETNIKYSGDRYGSAAVYSEGKAYILGGGCGATITYTGANRVIQTTLQSQPQIAKYSRFIDTDTDVFPTKWLMNGLDNSIGAEWRMKYRSMTDNDGDAADCVTAMTTWGQETDFGKVVLGQPETYTPKDGSGTNTNCARYFYFNVTIDSQFSYGYPEDVTRGPTIADLGLFFTSDPGKRLRHGKTFTGGEQQPLDTPF